MDAVGMTWCRDVHKCGRYGALAVPRRRLQVLTSAVDDVIIIMKLLPQGCHCDNHYNTALRLDIDGTAWTRKLPTTEVKIDIFHLIDHRLTCGYRRRGACTPEQGGIYRFSASSTIVSKWTLRSSGNILIFNAHNSLSFPSHTAVCCRHCCCCSLLSFSRLLFFIPRLPTERRRF